MQNLSAGWLQRGSGDRHVVSADRIEHCQFAAETLKLYIRPVLILAGIIGPFPGLQGSFAFARGPPVSRQLQASICTIVIGYVQI
jgi:hypothetical protein